MATARRALSLGVVVVMAAGAAIVAASPVSATFPGKNGRIAFVSDRSGNDEIYVMEPDGSGLTNVTNDAAGDRGPVWSPDGKRIVFVRTINKQDDIWVMNSDGSGQQQLTNLPSGEFSPHFAPDGETIVFTSNRGGPEEIFVMDADGTNQTQVTFNAFRDFGPHFSPDGTTIVFTSQRAGGTDSQIFVMRSDGSNQTQLTPDGSNSFAPDYSPDGEKIIFSSARTGDPEIFVMDAGGGDQTNLTNNPANAEFAGHFSPDGERIVFGRRIGSNNNEIFVMNADGSDQTNITNNSAGDQGPDWQPLELDSDVTVTKRVNGTPVPGSTYEVNVVCDNGDDEFTKTLTFGEAGGTQSFERESFGPLECEATESNTGGATSVEITCANAKNAECKQNGRFELFDDPGDDKTTIEINLTNTFPVTAEPTFTG